MRDRKFERRREKKEKKDNKERSSEREREKEQNLRTARASKNFKNPFFLYIGNLENERQGEGGRKRKGRRMNYIVS